MFVYAMLDREGDVKIGWSASPHVRAKQVQCESNRKIVVVIPVPCHDLDCNMVEKTCHRLHRAYHITGEWFNITIKQAVETIRMVAACFRRYPTFNSFMMLEWMFYEKHTVNSPYTFKYFDKKQYMMERK